VSSEIVHTAQERRGSEDGASVLRCDKVQRGRCVEVSQDYCECFFGDMRDCFEGDVDLTVMGRKD